MNEFRSTDVLINDVYPAGFNFHVWIVNNCVHRCADNEVVFSIEIEIPGDHGVAEISGHLFASYI